MTAVAPGKVILAGEHAVVYGRPAVVAAVNRYAYARVRPSRAGTLTLHLRDLGLRRTYGARELREVTAEVTGRYRDFLEGRLPVSRILDDPVQLFAHLIRNLLDAIGAGNGLGLEVEIRSELPLGAGMGSSAATLAATAAALLGHLGVELEKPELYRLVHASENLQHGRSSGVDPAIAVFGGMLRFQDGSWRNLPVRSLELTLVDTGAPESTTGEAVQEVAGRGFPDRFWNVFAEVADELERALARRDLGRVISLVRRNHRLLCEIGVVPPKVRRFVEEVERRGGAAKISGAGAVRGERAGTVLVVGETADLAGLCSSFGYGLFHARVEASGARLV